MDWLYEDGRDLERDMLRSHIEGWIKHNIHLDSGERVLPIFPNDTVVVLPAIPYPDEEEKENEQRKAA